ncbi:hypothetical protein FYS35_14990 [Salmonella enterica]|nr:hypothetical protein [Salmonella enterica]EBF8444664.1 hypothetical protein [Salmonella enterica subsp. enterica serovar Arechavaleta]EBF8683554.1 hypothetical protein [Salmonella enterica subsp. enterica]EAW4507951.1 hypothetical protein [Salmonella enterica]EAW6752763.1 hypothetical protein [Salmonella enterica]
MNQRYNLDNRHAPFNKRYLLSQKPVLRKRLLGHIPIATLRPRQDEIFSLMTTSVSHIRHPVKAK